MRIVKDHILSTPGWLCIYIYIICMHSYMSQPYLAHLALAETMSRVEVFPNESFKEIIVRGTAEESMLQGLVYWHSGCCMVHPSTVRYVDRGSSSGLTSRYLALFCMLGGDFSGLSV